MCQISYFFITRNQRYFRDPLKFRPARWLPPGHPKYDARFANDNLKSFFPFGLGPRACTGREIAWSQTRLFLAKVLWTFDVELIYGKDFTLDRDFSTYVMWNKPELRVRFTPRWRSRKGRMEREGANTTGEPTSKTTPQEVVPLYYYVCDRCDA